MAAKSNHPDWMSEAVEGDPEANPVLFAVTVQQTVGVVRQDRESHHTAQEAAFLIVCDYVEQTDMPEEGFSFAFPDNRNGKLLRLHVEHQER